MEKQMSQKANPERINKETLELSAISDICEEGVSRHPYTKIYRRAAEHVKKKMEELGLETKEDDIGNVYGILKGRNSMAPHIITGSHLDTVHCGGAYDGAAGIICALEAIRIIIESGHKLESSLEVIATIGEEGARFGTSFIGSRFIEGSLKNDDLYRIVDYDGITLFSALKEYKQKFNAETAYRGNECIKAFIELHIEQGPQLENRGINIGIVENINYVFRYLVKVEGISGHSGTLPMDIRHDAGIGAFHMITNINRYVTREHLGDATVTVGQLQLFPGSLNVIPKECEFIFDIRTGHKEVLEDIKKQIENEKKGLEDLYGLQVSMDVICDVEARALNKVLNDIIENSAEKLGASTLRINSGAGHDAMVFSRIWDSAMIFVPSCGGITHNSKEYTSPYDLAIGADVLAETILMTDII